MRIKDFSSKILPKSEFVKNSLFLVSGTTIAQFLPMVIYPILGRIYLPDQFGFLASFTAIVAILAVFSTGKYEMSILIADSDEDAANISVMSLLLSVILLFVSVLFLFLFRNNLESYFKTDVSVMWMLLFPISALSINVFNCYNEWCVRKKYYKQLSLNKITNSFSVSIGKLLLGFVKFSKQDLTLGDVLGRVFTAIVCIYRVLKRDFVVFKSVSLSRMVSLSKRYKDFPIYTMPAQLLNTLGASIPILMIGYFYSNELGYYSMASSVVALPISVISVAVRDVFRQKACEEYKRNGHFDKLFIRIFKYISLISILGAACVYFFLPDIFSFVLGSNWVISGYYTQILLPMVVFDFIAMSLSGVLTITEKLKQILIWQIYFVVISVISIVVGGIFFNSIENTLKLFSFARSTAYIYLIIISYYYSRGYGKTRN